jgi:hypothetical protein
LTSTPKRHRGWISRAAIALTAAGTIAAGGTGMAMAGTQAAGAHAHPARASKTAVVAHKRTRPHFGSMLVTARAGRALYILPHGTCTGGCLAVWPRLLLPKGKTKPLGTSCLGTAKVGKTGRLQVTYVKERARGNLGTILVAAKKPLSGRALYTLPHGTCTGKCLTTWPRLALPTGRTLPLGANCLGTAKFGRSGLQVTYRGHRLYLYEHDSGHSVNGNGVGGFKVAKVAAHC